MGLPTTYQNNSKKILSASVKFWFITATLGQWIFGLYILLLYHANALRGDFEKWNQVMPKGHVPGEHAGNISTAIHVLFAAIMVIGGPLQFIPYIRNKFRTFHRWLGRIYAGTAFIVTCAGLVIFSIRGSVGSVDMHVFNMIQAIYILVFAVLVVRTAMKRKIDTHRKWAIRLFLVSNGVWFFRVGFMAWFMFFQRPVGFDMDSFTGPFLSILSCMVYALPLPLLLAEMYFIAQKKNNTSLNTITSSLIIIFTLFMAWGIFGATMGMWLPRI